MNENLTRDVARKSIQISPERHKALKHLATDREVNMIKITDQVIAEGLKAIQQTTHAKSA